MVFISSGEGRSVLMKLRLIKGSQPEVFSDVPAFNPHMSADGHYVSYYSMIVHDRAPYVVSELLEGETLRERMAGAALPQRKAIDYALQVARGLAAAHEKGIVHRDNS